MSGELALEDLLSTSQSIVLSRNQGTRPTNKKMPAEESNSIDDVSINFEVADFSTQKFPLPRRKIGQKADLSRMRSLYPNQSWVPQSLHWRRRLGSPKGSHKFFCRWEFPSHWDWRQFYQDRDWKGWGKVMKSPSKSVSKYHPVSPDIATSIYISIHLIM